MNPMDILGGLLKKRSGRSSGGGGGGGLGGVLLDSILKGGRKRQTTSAPADMRRPSGSPAIRRDPDHEEFDSLEDLLHYSKKKHSSRRGWQAEKEEFPAAVPEMPQRQSRMQAEYDGNPEPFNSKAKLLVVAMINAAKADGRIEDDEQSQIIQQLGELSQDEIQFLRSEFARKTDVRDFAWSVPLGMEEQIYAVSLMAIDVDRQSEMDYLKQLAHGFRMTADRCNRIHAEFGAPPMR